MKITYFTHDPLNYKVEEIPIGRKLAGKRILSFELSSHEELQQLLSDKGISWARNNILFPPNRTREFHIRHEITDNTRESNWGSDWVDDGV